jgi:hypothetical protein
MLMPGEIYLIPESVNQITFETGVFKPIADRVINRIGVDSAGYPYADSQLIKDLLLMSRFYLDTTDNHHDKLQMGSLGIRLFCLMSHLRDMSELVSKDRLAEIAVDVIPLAARATVKHIGDAYYFDSEEMDGLKNPARPSSH